MASRIFPSGVNDTKTCFTFNQAPVYDLSLMEAERAVFRNVGNIVPDGMEQPADAVVLPAACGNEPDTFFL